MGGKEMLSHSKLMSYALRHKPGAIGITLDQNGWVGVQALLEGMNRAGHLVSQGDIEFIVRTDEKGRYAFNADRTKIRANQGHSFPVDVELAEAAPPSALYHGTAERFLGSIKETGLRPQGRLYVHLSKDPATALEVGNRHGSPVVLAIEAAAMANDGFVFYLSGNGVWLAKHVPPIYLREWEARSAQ